MVRGRFVPVRAPGNTGNDGNDWELLRLPPIIVQSGPVAQDIAGRFPVQWILFGTATDVPIGAKIAEALGDKCVNRIGQTTLEQLINELRGCDLGKEQREKRG